MLSLSKPAARQPRKWTLAEDQKLREEVEAQRLEGDGEVKDWCRVAAKLPNRTNKDCRKRWLNSVAGGLKKGQWAKSEDLQLARGVEQFGQRWTLVAEVVGSRSADQCAKRWQQSLDPDLDRSEWRESEDQILVEAVQRLGRHWKDIQQLHFPGRSKNCIKNRYTVIIRRYQNSGIPLPEGLSGSQPGTPGHRMSTYSTPDDDRMSYPDNHMYDDILTHTQVSTPETQHSWSMEEEPFTTWASTESFITPAVAPTEFAKFPPHSYPQVTSSQQWAWAASSMAPQPTMGLGTPTTIAPAFSAQPSSYHTYGPMQGMAVQPRAVPGSSGHRASFQGRGPTSSPGLVNPASYQDPEVMNRYMKYGSQSDAPYRF